MAGKAGKSGRKPIPEGAKKEKGGEIFYRKNGKWKKIKENDFKAENPKNEPVENSDNEGRANNDRILGGENNQPQDDKNELQSRKRPSENYQDRPGDDFNQSRPSDRVGAEENSSGRSSEHRIDDSEGLNSQFAEMEDLLNSAPDPAGLAAPGEDFSEEAEQEDGGVSISGDMLIRIFDFGGRLAISMIYPKITGKPIDRKKLKLTNEEREELTEFADEAAKTINIKAAGNPWMALTVTYLIIIALKIEE